MLKTHSLVILPKKRKSKGINESQTYLSSIAVVVIVPSSFLHIKMFLVIIEPTRLYPAFLNLPLFFKLY